MSAILIRIEVLAVFGWARQHAVLSLNGGGNNLPAAAKFSGRSMLDSGRFGGRQDFMEQNPRVRLLTANPGQSVGKAVVTRSLKNPVNQIVMKNVNHQLKSLLLAGLATFGVATVQAAIQSYTVSFGPASGVTTSGTGSGIANYDDVGHLLTLQASWSGLTGNTTVSHIHLPTATPFTGTAGVVITPGNLTGFPAGVTSGAYSNTFDMTLAATYPAAFLTANGGTAAGAEAAVANAFAQGRAYWNIHTSFAGGGEINGFLTAVPEPSRLALVGLGAVGIAGHIWRRKRAKVS